MRRIGRTLVLMMLAASSCRPAAPSGGRLVLGQITSAVTLDPHKHDQLQSTSTLGHFYDTLVSFGPEMDLRPELAERWENPSDTIWRFHLRPGVVFHDGRALGAEDVVASLRRALMPGSHVRHYVQSIEEVRATDEMTVEVVTRHPTPVLLNKLVFVPIVPRTTPPGLIEHPIGTGPYRFVSGQPGAVIEGVRFDHFWGPQPTFERVVFLPLPDARERAEAVARGRADLVAQFPIEYWESGGKQPGIRLVSSQGLGAVLLAFSLRPGSPFADVRVRRAIALGLDRTRIVQEALRGLAAPLDQLVPPTVVGYSNKLKPLGHDSEAAAKLLKQAGLTKGFDAPFLVTGSQSEVGAEVVKQLGDLGIRLEMNVLAQKEFYERWSREEVPLSLLGWSSNTGDASETLEPLFHSPQEGYGGFNHFSYANPDLDRLIELADRTLRPTDRREHLAAAMRLLQNDLPVLPLALRFDLYAVRKDLDWVPRLDRKIRASDIRPVEAP